MPMMVVAMIPISRAPGTLRMTRMPVITRPMTDRSPAPEVTSPRSTSVAGLSMTIPPPLRPIRAMKRPIPAPIAFLSDRGRAFTIASRTFVRVSTMNMRPSMRTAVRANCHEYPMPRQTV